MDDTPDHTEDDKYKFGLANSTSSSSPKTCSKSPEKVVPVFSTTELKSNSPKEGNTIVLDVDSTSKVKEQLNSKGTIHVEKVYVGCSPKKHSQTPPKANTNTNKEDFLSREDLGSATRELKKDNIKSHTKDCSCNPCKKGRKRAELGLKDVKCKDKGKIRLARAFRLAASGMEVETAFIMVELLSGTRIDEVVEKVVPVFSTTEIKSNSPKEGNTIVLDKGRKRAELGLKDVKCKDKGKVRKSKVHQKGKRSSRIRSGSFQGKETKCKKLNNGKIGKIWDAVDVSWCYQEAKGLSGGILILWKESSFVVSHVLKSRYWVAIKGSCTASKEKVLLINVYGPHQDGKRSINWSQLCHLVLSWNGPCCAMGDFNITRYDHERRRQGHHRRSQEIFDKFIIKSNMIDLPLLGKKFTWSGKDGKCSRIDRCCVSVEWMDIWGHLDLSCLDIDLSDHNTIRLDSKTNGRRLQISLKCEEQWSLMTVVGSSLEKVMHKFRRLKIFLKKWSKEKFWNVESELSACKMLIQSIEEAPLWDLDLEQKLFDLKLKKAKLDRDLEIKWRQRARISWLKEGD
ncbi:reverse transcriptase [Artemisia annua]|uniref:Reverse transcriptase n=1 Tax=Artemisia annua TaxID=35608 RepID=A0A2U1MKB8_ARTAN|nr:reverse transcriptase [Artemisia annua]